MVALEEWLAAIEEDYQTFLTLPTPFTGNKYWRPAKPIEKWDNYSYQLLIDCQPCKAFKELREQIDADLAEFDVAPDYNDILKRIEDHHHWARSKVSNVSPDDPRRLSLIDHVLGDWQQIQRLADVLQDFVYPFGNAERARPGRRKADFFASFYGGIITLCNWLSDYDQQVQQYRRSCREREITRNMEERERLIQTGITPPEDEPVYTTSPEGDLKNHELRQGYMLRLEIVAQLLGQLVSLRFPVLARRFSLLTCAPTIPINHWKEREDFPFGKLMDELQQVLHEAQVRRHEAAKMKDTPEEAPLPKPTATFTPTLKQFGENLVGRFLTAANTYPELHLVAVYGGNAFANWPEVPGRVAGELTVGLWQQDWRDVLGINSNDVPPISAPWLAIEDQLWEAGFYSVRKPNENETSQQLDKHVQAGLKEFKQLAILAANHLGIAPTLANDESAAALRVDRSNLFHRWLERLLSTPERYQQTERPNDFTIRRLTGDVFSASAQELEDRLTRGGGSDNDNGGIKGGKTDSPASPKKAAAKSGRKPADEQTRKKEEKLYRDWQIASGRAEPMVDFAKSKGYRLNELVALIDRVRKRLKLLE